MTILNQSAQVMLEFKNNNNLTDGEFTNLLERVNEYDHQLEDCVVYDSYDDYIQTELDLLEEMLLRDVDEFPFIDVVKDMFDEYVRDMNSETLARVFGIGLNDTVLYLDDSDKVVVVS